MASGLLSSGHPNNTTIGESRETLRPFHTFSNPKTLTFRCTNFFAPISLSSRLCVKHTPSLLVPAHPPKADVHVQMTQKELFGWIEDEEMSLLGCMKLRLRIKAIVEKKTEMEEKRLELNNKMEEMRNSEFESLFYEDYEKDFWSLPNETIDAFEDEVLKFMGLEPKACLKRE